MRVTVAVALLVACQPSGEPDPRERVQAMVFEEPVPFTPRYARLTHLQWENAVRDLLHLSAPTGLSGAFIGDPLSEGFDNDAAGLGVSPELWQQYQWAAETLAASVVDDSALYAAVVPGAPEAGRVGTDEIRDAWIRDLGGRAHRRPLTAEQVATYAELFRQGPELVGSGDDFADGVELVVTALLQSPWFLYRIEDSSAPDASGRVPLSSWEIASKLSFGLWNTMPDDALFEAAAADALRRDEEIRAEVERMLDDPRVRGTVADLHRQLLHLDSYANIVKDGALFPEFRPTTPASMVAEAQAFVGSVIFEGGGVRALLTAPRTFVNQDLAPIYGVQGVAGDALVPVELDPDERAGLLTLSGFLALEADARVHSPIRRGVLVNEEVLCADLPPPPAVLPPLPPPAQGETTRERVEAHTGDGTCGQGCHSTVINPIGFAYERYDALGRYRTTENGQPVDSSATYTFEEGARPFADAVDLAAELAAAPEVHRCYASHWLSYLEGRVVTDADGPLLERVAQRSLDEDLPIRDLLIELTLSNGFRYRAAGTEP